jgi:hypothetical protein
VSPGYFQTMRIPLVKGRLFAERRQRGTAVALINQSLARQFSGEDPIGKQITWASLEAVRQSSASLK